MKQRTPDDRAVFEGVSTEELLRAVRDGRDALFELVTRFAGELHRATAARPPEPTRPSDAAQDWYGKFLQRFVRLLPHFADEGAFKAYLRSAALNQYRANAADQRLQPTAGPDHDDAFVDPVTPSEAARANEDDRRRAEDEETLGRCVAALGEADRMIYRLLFHREWSHRDIAELVYGGRGERHRQRVVRRLERIKRQLENQIWARNGDGAPEGPEHERRGNAGL